MKTVGSVSAILLLLTFNSVVFSQTFTYISPKDNSILVSLSTNIILRSSENVDPSSLSPGEFSVTGSTQRNSPGYRKIIR